LGVVVPVFLYSTFSHGVFCDITRGINDYIYILISNLFYVCSITSANSDVVYHN